MTGQEIDQDKNSTNWSFAYYTKDLKKDRSRHLIDKLAKVQRFYEHHGSLRIHFIMPGLASSNDGSDRGGCRVENNDDVIMYIDSKKLEKLFQSFPDIAETIKRLL